MTTAAALARRVPDGWTVAPAFVDLQVNGYGGAEIGDDPAGWAEVARAVAAAGVARFCPTLVTRSDRGYARAARALQRVAWPRDAARPAGVHLEGPFLAASRAGAHSARRLRPPDREAVERLAALFSPAVVTLAPELPGALDAVAWLRRRGVVVSLGHTEAGAGAAAAAFRAGARMVTHALNAMPGIAARDGGPAGAALADGRVAVCLIGDGRHVHREAALALARGAGRRLVLVSDATAATGAAPGRYPLGERTVVWDGELATTGGRLAGGVAGVDAGVRTLTGWGLPARRAVAAASSAPARVLRLRDRPGDVVALDEALVPRLTVVDGVVAFADPGLPFDVPEPGRPFAR